MRTSHHPGLLAVVVWFAAASAVVATTAYSPSATALDDPQLDYHTITTPHFHVHYYNGLEDLAHRTAVIAEESHQVLSPLLDWEPASRTHVLVTDQQDRANGFARVFGRNFITIFGKPPTPEGTLGYYDDWLRVLFYHEYVHILHLDTNPGIAQWVNRLIGKQFHPNSALPRWYIEGIAVYLEAVRTGRGRVNSPLYRMWLRVAALDDDLFSLGRASGLPLVWPSGSGPYLYGAFFIEYLTRHHGENFINEFNHRYGRRLAPYAMNAITRDLTGRDLEEHWEGFIAEAEAEALATKIAVESAGRTSLEKLTDSGGRNRYPTVRPGSGADVTFHRADLTDHPVYTDVTRSGRIQGPIRDADGAAGPAVWCPDGETLYFSRSEFDRNVYRYQDLFAYTPDSGRLRRLTEADRAREPDVHPDGTHLVHVRNRAGSMELVERPLSNPGDERILLGRNDWPADHDAHWQQISQPVYTPDGDGVVFSWWRADRRQRDLYRLDLHTGESEALTDSPAHDIDPHFGPEGLLYFASDVDDVFNIHAMDIDTGEIWQVSNVVRGVFHPQVTPDREWIYVYTYTHRGFEIARFRHPQRLHHPDRRAETRANPRLEYPEVDPENIGEPTDYRPLPWLGPMFFTPDAGVLTGGAGVGATVSGYDPVEHHEYTLSGGFTTGPDFEDRASTLGIGYQYSGSALDLSLRARVRNLPRTRDLVAESRFIPFVERQYRGNISLSYPIRTHDHRFSLSTGYRIDYTTPHDEPAVEHEPGDIPPRHPESGFFNSWQFRLSYGSTHRYRHSISTERGVRAGTGISLQHPALGHPDSGVTFNYSLELYQPNPLVDRHVFAFRNRGAVNRSATGRQRRFGIGGHSPQDVLTSAIFQDERGGFPLRGYEPGLLRGTQYQISKLEYRFPLLDLDRGFGTVPLFFRNLKGRLFVDTGTADDGYLLDADFHTGIGGEIQLDAILGYYLRNTLRLGYARGLDPDDGLSEFYLLFGGGF